MDAAFDHSIRVMEQHFDFESAASSPGLYSRRPSLGSPSQWEMAIDATPPESQQQQQQQGISTEDPASGSAHIVILFLMISE